MGGTWKYTSLEGCDCSKPTSFKDPLHNTTRFLYNAQLAPTELVNAKGYPIKFKYDSKGKLVETLLTAEGARTHSQYDAYGNLRAVISP